MALISQSCWIIDLF